MHAPDKDMMSIGNTILPVAVTFNHVTLSSNAVVHPNCAPHELWDHLDLSWIWKTACSFTTQGTCTCLVILQLLCIRAIPSPLPSCYWMFAQHNDIFWNGKMVRWSSPRSLQFVDHFIDRFPRFCLLRPVIWGGPHCGATAARWSCFPVPARFV